MRRITVLFVIALVGAWIYGASGIGSGVVVNNEVVSAQTLRSELAAIATHPALDCYLSALNSDFESLSGSTAYNAAASAQWVNMRIEGTAISQYVKKNFNYVPTAQDLAKAASSLEGELTQAAKSNNFACPGSAAKALSEMPSEMRSEQINAQAGSLLLLSKVQATIPLTTSALENFFTKHKSSYDVDCVSIAVVPSSKLTAFASAQAAGESVSALAKKFSIDPSATAGGAYGCYGPTTSEYTAIRSDVGTTPVGKFPTTPQIVSYQGSDEALYVAITKRTPVTYAQAKSLVLSDVREQNASGANAISQDILYEAAVGVDPAFGQWGLSSSSGPGVFAPASPALKNVTGATQAASAVSAS